MEVLIVKAEKINDLEPTKMIHAMHLRRIDRLEQGS
jgi:hypothetical protein